MSGTGTGGIGTNGSARAAGAASKGMIWRTIGAATAGAALLLTGCAAPAPAPTESVPPVSIAPEVQVDAFSPLILSHVAGLPIPVRGTDGLYHLVYELEVFNASPRPATIDSIVSTVDGATVGELSGPELVARTLPIGDYPFPPEAASELPAGTTAVILMDTTFEQRDAVPTQILQTIEASFGEVRPGQGNYANLFPRSATATIVTEVGEGSPIVVGPPLTGPDWVAANACCSLSPHRGTMVPIGGRINAAERYAIDWSRFDLTRPLVDGDAQSTFEGDRTKQESYFTYNQPVIAVADAEVAVVVDGLKDAEPGVLQQDLPLHEYGGNYVVLKLSEGVYALYAHLVPGSIVVKEGDKVKLGDELAKAGNSGNSTEAHLHFHVMDGISPLTATNLPFEISSFTFLGYGSEDGSTFIPDPSERKNELPLILSAISFPE